VTQSDSSEAARRARRDRRREGRREAILEAAGRVLVKDGLAGFTAGAVAEAADCSKPALFYYFDSVEAIAAALAEARFRREIEALESAIDAAPSGIEALSALVRAYVDHHAEDLEIFSVLQVWGRSAGVQERLLRGEVYPAAAVINDRLEALLRRERRAGRLHPEVHPRRLAHLAYTTAHGIVSMVSAVRGLGGDTRFSLSELRDEAAAALERAARA
jgi:AcrR family transcriptional regulator